MIKKKVLVIVAHPDDEIIWMGGLLFKNRNKWEITVLSLCRSNDSDRALKFKRVCCMLNVKGIISDLDDKKLNPLNVNKIIKKIQKLPIGKDYDYIFTHGSNGEYGHLRHKEIHNAVRKMVKMSLLIADRIFFFSYLKKENDFQGYCICNSNANMFIKLSNKELLMKKKIIQSVYGYLKGGFEEKSCGKIESFEILK